MRRTSYLIATLGLILLLLAGCSAPTRPTTLTIFAAASLKESFSEISQAFESAHPGVKVSLNFGGSQQLAEQINEGAPADIFASAGQKPIDSLSVPLASKVSIFARNRLVIITPKENPAQLQEPADLARPGIKLVLAGKDVPAGQYALTFLENASQDPAFGGDFAARVQANIISYETNVKSVLSKVALGEADAGIVYISDAQNSEVQTIAIPDELNVIAFYPIVILQESPAAQEFVQFVIEKDGAKILSDNGFLPGE